MRLIHRFTSIVLTALVIFAPLLCVRFCQLHAAALLALPTSMTRVAMTMHHAAGHQHDAPADVAHTHHVPLDELKQMVTAVTEFVVAPASFATLMLVVLLASLCIAMPRRLAPRVPTPPPKFADALV